MPFQKAIVVGASSGIGAELVKQLLAQGATVAGVARNQNKLLELSNQFGPSLLTYIHDVRDYRATAELFTRITKDLGGLDVIFYCSGVMPSVSESEFNFEKDQIMVETNLLGAISWLNLAAERFRNTSSGTIVGIGSVAGDRGRQGQPVYNTTKAALATYLEALRNRLSRHGVKVVTIKPGPVNTEMTKAAGIVNGMPVDQAVRKILELSHRNGEHYLSWKHKLIFYVIKRVPSPIFRKIKI